MGKKRKGVKYLLENKSATARELADAVGISYGYALSIKKKIGTPQVLDAPKKLTRSDVLDTAKNLVNGDRPNSMAMPQTTLYSWRQWNTSRT